MKRHSQLVPLSKDHHQQLLLARLLRDDAPPYKGLPSTPADKVAFAQQQYQLQIPRHFQLEEKLFSAVNSYADRELKDLLNKQHIYQKRLKSMFREISVNDLDRTGRFLEEAIRHEERILFQAIQSKIDLDTIDLML
jgi:hypothetical protein